jgi:hypothetical protein
MHYGERDIALILKPADVELKQRSSITGTGLQSLLPQKPHANSSGSAKVVAWSQRQP